MTFESLSRRDFLKTTGAALASSAFVGWAGADGTGFESVEVATGKSLYSVSETREGPYAVGNGGRILARRATGWEVVLDSGPTAQGKPLYGTDVTDDGRVVWMCGGSGRVAQYHVVDELVTDYSFPRGNSNTWGDVAVSGPAGDELVVAVNPSGQLVRGWKTPEGGMDWEKVRSPTGGNAIFGIDFYDANGGFLCGSGGDVYHTQDAGATWTQIGISGESKTLHTVAARGPEDALFVGNSGRIHRYDGGFTKHDVGGSSILGIARGGDATYAVGESGHHYDRTDTGWTASEFGTDKTLFGATLGDGGLPDVVVGGSGTVLERGEYDVKPNRVRIVSRAATETGYAFDVTGDITGGEAGESLDALVGTSPVDVLGAVSGEEADRFEFSGEIENFRITDGSAENIAVYVNGNPVSVERLAATEWQAVQTPIDSTLYAVADSTAGPHATGSNGRILTRRDGEWTVAVDDGPNGGGNTLYAVDATADGDALWVAGGSGALGRYDVSTRELANHTAPKGLTSSWQAVEVVPDGGSETVFVANSSGELLRGRYEDGKVRWGKKQKPGNGSSIAAISFVDGRLGHLVDTSANVFRSTDGGKTWSRIGLDKIGVTLADVAAVSRDRVTLVGGSGAVCRYNGAVWTRLDTGGSTRHAVDRNDDRAVAAGANGTVLTRGVTGWEQPDVDPGSALYGAVLTGDEDLPAVVVGGGGSILEQSYVHSLY